MKLSEIRKNFEAEFVGLDLTSMSLTVPVQVYDAFLTIAEFAMREHSDYDDKWWCAYCDTKWPCPTRKALDLLEN